MHAFHNLMAVCIKLRKIVRMGDSPQQLGVGEKLIRSVAGDVFAGRGGIDELQLRTDPEFPIIGVIGNYSVPLNKNEMLRV